MSEEIAATTNRLTALTAILLPPSLLAGLLGVNVAGIPFANEPWAFGAICATTVLLIVLEVWLLRRMKWF